VGPCAATWPIGRRRVMSRRCDPLVLAGRNATSPSAQPETDVPTQHSLIGRFRRRMHRCLRLHHVHRHRTIAHTAGVLLLLVGVSALTVGVTLGLVGWTGAPRGETSRTTGVFVSNGPWPGCEDTAAFHMDGKRFSAQVRSTMTPGGYSSAGSYCQNHRIGSRISIAYAPTDPTHASVQFNRPPWVWISFMLLGASFIVFGWLFVPPQRSGHSEHPMDERGQASDSPA
jgi:hypothetical protein